MGEHEIEAFLTYLAMEREVSPSTQNQALAALNRRLRLRTGKLGDWEKGRLGDQVTW
jgi:hypothetical protein